MKILNKFLAILTVFMLFIQSQVIDAIAVTGYLTNYPRLSDLYFISIESYEHEGDEMYELKKFSSSGSSLYDRKLKAKKKHHKGDVYIRYQQRVYAECTDLTIDGKLISHGYSYDDENGYISQTGKYGLIAWKNEYHTYDVDDAVLESEFKLTSIVVDEKGTHTYTQTLTVEWIDDGRDAPENVSFSSDPASGTAILENVDSTMEYRVKGSSNTAWKRCSDSQMKFTVPSADTVYHIRYAATDENPQSKVLNVTLKGKRPAPSCTYDQATEILSGLTDKMEMKLGDDDYVPVPAGTTSISMSDYIDNLSDGKTLTFSVRYPHTEDISPNYAFSRTLYPRSAIPDSIVFDPVSLNLSGISSAMQYRLSDSASWSAISKTSLSLAQFASPEKDVTILVRYKPTTTNSASHEKSFTIAKLLDGPAGMVDYANEVISGFDDDTAYQYYYGTPPSTASWYNAVIVNGSFNISNGITTYARTVNIRKAATDTAPITYYTTFDIPARLQAPTAPAFVYNDEEHYGKAVLTGVTSDMEYKISSSTSWTPVGSDNVVLDIPNANTTYYVRYKATADNFASSYKSITLYGKSTAPTPAYNTTTENITGLTTAMEISYNGSEYTAVEATSMNMSEIIDGLTEAMTVNIRKSATSTAPASATKTFILYPRLSAPTTVIYNKANISLSGVSNKMQYKFETSTSWTAFTGTSFSLLSYASKDQDVKVLVRYSPTTANAASLPVEFTIPKLLDGPDCSIDFLNEKITGLDDNTSYQYFVGTNPSTTSSWASMKTVNGSFDISGIAASASKVFNIRKAATATEPITNYTTLNLSARKAALTTPYFVYNNENYYDKAVLEGVTSDMEYKISSSTSWTPVGNNGVVLDIPNANTTYYVRYKSTSENFASLNRAVTLYGKAAAPTPAYNTTTENITGLTTAMEISYNGSEYTAVEATSMNMLERIDNLTEALTINIRKSATSTAPASAIKTFKLYPRLNVPTTVVYNNATISLTGLSNKMQYRLETNTSWTTLSGTTLNLTSYASKEQDIKVFVRYAATTTNAASLPLKFTIPKLLDGPSCSIDYINEKITGLDDNTSYQYFIGTNPSTTASWASMKTVNGSFDISGIAANASKVFNIRKAATATEPITNYTTLNLSARKSAPTTPYFVYNNENYYGKAVLEGVTSDMEYKISSSTSWTPVENNDVVLDIPNANTTTTYYVRYKSTSENFASLNRAVTLYGKAAAPTSAYNTTTENITGLTTAMKISYNGSEYTAVETTSMNMSERIDNLTEALTINIRKSATSAAPASASKTITIYPRLNAPTAVIYNGASILLSGVSNKMQYRFETSTSWTTFTGTTFSLLSYASKEKDVKIFVRYSPTTTNAASLPVEFTIPKLLDGPNCNIDYTNEMITGLDDNTSYQYFVGTNPTTTSKWLAMQTVNGNLDISSIIASTSKTINIRKAATANEPITNYTTLILAARKAAPTTPAFEYNNDNYYDKAVLTNVTPNMEYRLSTDLKWIEITGNELVFDVPDYGMTYYIRYKATSESFPSSYKSLTLSNRKTAPSCIYNQFTQTITKLSSSMEIKIGEIGSYTPVASTTYDLSDVVLSTNFVTVYIRYKATNTQPASYVQVITCDCNANVVSNELDFVFDNTTVDDYDVVNPNKEFDNASYDMTMEDYNPLNPNDEFDEPLVEPIAEDYNLTEPYVFNNDTVN